MLRLAAATALLVLLAAAPAQAQGAYQSRVAVAAWETPALDVTMAGVSYRDTGGRREDGRLLRILHTSCDEGRGELVVQGYDALLPVEFDDAGLTATSRATAIAEGAERRFDSCRSPSFARSTERDLPSVEVSSDLQWVARAGVPTRPPAGVGVLGCPGVFAETGMPAVVLGELRGDLPVGDGLRLQDLGTPSRTLIGFSVEAAVC